MNAPSYPPPPWNTHGWGAFRAYRVPATRVSLPPDMTPRSVLGQSSGLLAYIEYQPPSPLSYRELIWMPAWVRARSAKSKHAHGYFVAKMYVDDETSLRAGRDVWALPKSLAHFERNGETVRISADDGTRAVLRIRPRGPALPLRASIATVQDGGAHWTRFRSSFRAMSSSANVDVLEFDSRDPGWQSFQHATAIPLTGVRLAGFSATMHAPRALAK